MFDTITRNSTILRNKDICLPGRVAIGITTELVAEFLLSKILSVALSSIDYVLNKIQGIKPNARGDLSKKHNWSKNRSKSHKRSNHTYHHDVSYKSRYSRGNHHRTNDYSHKYRKSSQKHCLNLKDKFEKFCDQCSNDFPMSYSVFRIIEFCILQEIGKRVLDRLLVNTICYIKNK